jgi:hypothetical protein
MNNLDFKHALLSVAFLLALIFAFKAHRDNAQIVKQYNALETQMSAKDLQISLLEDGLEHTSQVYSAKVTELEDQLENIDPEIRYITRWKYNTRLIDTVKNQKSIIDSLTFIARDYLTHQCTDSTEFVIDEDRYDSIWYNHRFWPLLYTHQDDYLDLTLITYPDSMQYKVDLNSEFRVDTREVKKRARGF